MVSLFGLAPDGVYPAADVATSAVSSYLAISTLPDPLPAIGGIFSVALSITSRRRSLTGILLCGARTFLSIHADAATV